tara:strand:+ start:52 stop:690 length:639 start_codon:yes stop_codon:yes gene_type:complete
MNQLQKDFSKLSMKNAKPKCFHCKWVNDAEKNKRSILTEGQYSFGLMGIFPFTIHVLHKEHRLWLDDVFNLLEDTLKQAINIPVPKDFVLMNVHQTKNGIREHLHTWIKLKGDAKKAVSQGIPKNHPWVIMGANPETGSKLSRSNLFKRKHHILTDVLWSENDPIITFNPNDRRSFLRLARNKPKFHIMCHFSKYVPGKRQKIERCEFTTGN